MTEEAAVEAEDNSQAVADAINRPENVPEKFWNNDTKSVNNDQVLESYNQLSSKFGAFTGAPEAYEFKLSDELTANGVELSADDPLINTFREYAKESNMSNDHANQLINMFVENQYAQGQHSEEAETTRIAEQMGLLGDNAQQRVDNIGNWARANLTPEQVEGLSDAATTAAGVQAIEALIAKSKNSSVQPSEGNNVNQTSMADLQALQFAKDEHGNRKMSSDPEYARMVRQKMADAYPGENIITVG
jgi:hypothetical protein